MGDAYALRNAPILQEHFHRGMKVLDDWFLVLPIAKRSTQLIMYNLSVSKCNNLLLKILGTIYSNEGEYRHVRT